MAGKPETVVWRNDTAAGASERGEARTGKVPNPATLAGTAEKRKPDVGQLAEIAGARRSGSRRRAGSSGPAAPDRRVSSMLSESIPTSAAPWSTRYSAASAVRNGIVRRGSVGVPQCTIPARVHQHRPAADRPPGERGAIDRAARRAARADHQYRPGRPATRAAARTGPCRPRSGGTASPRRCRCWPPSRSCRSGTRPRARTSRATPPGSGSRR